VNNHISHLIELLLKLIFLFNLLQKLGTVCFIVFFITSACGCVLTVGKQPLSGSQSTSSCASQGIMLFLNAFHY